jgi:SAM-dependent methyltransferase
MGAKHLALELHRAEAAANILGRREEAADGWASSVDTSVNSTSPVDSAGGGRVRTTSAVKDYYNNQLPTYLKVWGEDGRIGWGYFESPAMPWKDAQQRQMERLAEMGDFNEQSVVLDLGCGAAINSFYLVRRYGCRVVGLDIAAAMIRKARVELARSNMECFDRLAFYEGDLAALVRDLQELAASAAPGNSRARTAASPSRGGSALGAAAKAGSENGNLEQGENTLRRLLGSGAANVRAPFTHLWSTNVNWFIPEAERSTIFKQFAAISTRGSRLVIDDCLCHNRVVTQRSQLCLYDRLNLDRLWAPAEYARNIEDSGFSVDVSEDISTHCTRSYTWLAKSARRLGQEKLALDYAGTVEAVKLGDLAWFNLVATRK